jgi:predicted RNA-binding protein with PIN domain
MSLHFVLDGYNLVKQDAHLAVLKLEAGRNGLLKLIETRELQGSKTNAVTIVFDGQLGASSERHASAGGGPGAGIEVVFTSFETADDWIKRFVEESTNSKILVVVTDDREIRHYVRALGAALMGTREFLEGRGSRRREADALRKSQRPQADKKEISSVMEHKITSEFSKMWLKDKK